ncbi:MAG: aminoacyl-tRNA hydrolase [Chromatiales bacterium]|nr:aminoacyl-tRNA hydrolase [Chromatiales bacterium]
MSTPLQLLVGLGNPGARYEDTRHNVGFRLIDRLARQCSGELRAVSRFQGEMAEVSIAGQRVRLLKPTTYMNHSGRAVSAVARFYRIEPAAIAVAFDDIDLPPGTVRLRVGGGDGGHRGLRDIIPALGNPGFLRIRLGVGHPGDRAAVVDYVLHRAGAAEQAAIDDGIERVLAEIRTIVRGESAAAMNALNRKAPRAATEPTADGGARD